MVSHNVCRDCGEDFITEAENPAAIMRHFADTGHAVTIGTSDPEWAARLVAKYQAKADPMGPSSASEEESAT